jgi:hypothetical protein
MSKRSALGRLLFTAVVVLTFLSLIPMASASAVGNFSEANCAGGGVTVSASSVTWLPTGSGGASTGCIQTGTATSPYLTWSGGTLTPGIVGYITNLVVGPPINDFMVFTSGSNTLDFVLTGFTTPASTYGVGATACAQATAGPAGSSCYEAANSPFLLTSNGSGSTAIALDVFGTVTDGGVTSSWMGSFTTQLNITPTNIYNIESQGGSVGSTQSGSFITVAPTGTPEPVTLPMIGGGLIALAMLARKRKARA